MRDQRDLLNLPPGLPVPRNDGAADHLAGHEFPRLSLPATSGGVIDLHDVSQEHMAVIFCYPRTGRPGENAPEDWDSIPGARGCTPEACAFRDLKAEFDRLEVKLFGLSTQSTVDQAEAAQRLHLTYALLSDTELHMTRALRLPTFEFDGITLVKRHTLIVRAGRIEHVFYPVFPPDRHADEVLAWLRGQD